MTKSIQNQEPDTTLARTFADALQQAGHTVFIDTKIRVGMNWIERIETALKKADFLLLLLSPEAAQSEMVVEEVMIAKELAETQNGVPTILPVKVQYPRDQRLPYHLSAYLRSIQQAQWTDPKDTPRLVDELLEAVSEQIGWQRGSPEPKRHDPIAHELSPQCDPRDLITPGGALHIKERLYIIRDADERVLREIHKDRSMVIIRGPRQTGKTSLMVRVCASVKLEKDKLRAAFVDFQGLPNASFESLNTLWQTIASGIAAQLCLDEWDEDEWNPKRGYDRNLNRFLDHHVFAEDGKPLLLCFDEVDRVFKSPIKNEFFGSVRSFYNLGAFDETWKNIRWLLASSSEPSFFIADLTQSPFNVGLREELTSFTLDEIEEFARRLNLYLSKAELARILDYVAGRPYLVHVLVNAYAKEPGAANQLFDVKKASQGLFREHLHRYLFAFQREPALAAGMRAVVGGRGCKDVALAARLEAAGLTRIDEEGKVIPACTLYATFFGDHLQFPARRSRSQN